MTPSASVMMSNNLPELQVTLLRQNLATPRRPMTQQSSSASSSTGGSASPSHTQTPSTSNIPDDVLGKCFIRMC